MVQKYDEDMNADSDSNSCHFKCAQNSTTSDNQHKSIVHFAGRLIGISAQSDRLLGPAIDRYNTSS